MPLDRDSENRRIGGTGPEAKVAVPPASVILQLSVGVSIVKRSTGRIRDSFSDQLFYPHDDKK